MSSLQRIENALRSRNITVRRDRVSGLTVPQPRGSLHRYQVIIELVHPYIAEVNTKVLGCHEGTTHQVNQGWQLINQINNQIGAKLKADPSTTTTTQIGDIGIAVDFFCFDTVDMMNKYIDFSFEQIADGVEVCQHQLITGFERIGLRPPC